MAYEKIPMSSPVYSIHNQGPQLVKSLTWVAPTERIGKVI